MEDVLDVYERPSEPAVARVCFDERPCQLLDEVMAQIGRAHV
jgi:hypothetical protein